MPLATHADKPEESLCDRAEEGHRRATTRGNELMKLGEWRSAEACYLAALRHKRDFPMALYGLGEAHAKHEDRYDLSVHAYELAIQLWPQYVDARVALGDAHLRRGYKKRARRAYAAAVEVAAADPLAWEALGRFYLDDAVRDYEQASVTYRRAALAVPAGGTSPGLLLGLAEAARGAEKWSECVDKADKAASLAPGFARARWRRRRVPTRGRGRRDGDHGVTGCHKSGRGRERRRVHESRDSARRAREGRGVVGGFGPRRRRFSKNRKKRRAERVGDARRATRLEPERADPSLERHKQTGELR